MLTVRKVNQMSENKTWHIGQAEKVYAMFARKNSDVNIHFCKGWIVISVLYYLFPLRSRLGLNKKTSVYVKDN